MKLSFQIHRGRHPHRPPLSLHTPWKNNNTYVGVTSVTSVQHSTQSFTWRWLENLCTLGSSANGYWTFSPTVGLEVTAPLLEFWAPPPLVYHDGTPSHRENSIVKLGRIISEISNDNESSCLEVIDLQSRAHREREREREQYPARRQQKQGAKCWF